MADLRLHYYSQHFISNFIIIYCLIVNWKSCPHFRGSTSPDLLSLTADTLWTISVETRFQVIIILADPKQLQLSQKLP